jgi:hypothetical protein
VYLDFGAGINGVRRQEIGLGVGQFALAKQNPAGGIQHQRDSAQLRAAYVPNTFAANLRVMEMGAGPSQESQHLFRQIFGKR